MGYLKGDAVGKYAFFLLSKNGQKIMNSEMKKSDFLTEFLRYDLKKADLHLTSVSVKDVKDNPSHVSYRK